MNWLDWTAAAYERAGLARRSRPAGPLVLTYHGVGGADGVSPTSLANQLDMLMESRQIVPLPQAVALLGRPESQAVAAVTFDDGYRDFSELALPILRARSLHATLFVPAGHLGGSNEWDRGRAPLRPLLSAEELAGLDPEVVEVGAHGMTHRRLVGLDETTLRRETLEARRVLEDVSGRNVSLFAYPYGQRGDFNREAEQAVEAAGYIAACTTCFGRGSRADQRYRMRRVSVRPTDDLRIFRRKLAGAYDWVAGKERAAQRLRSRRR